MALTDEPETVMTMTKPTDEQTADAIERADLGNAPTRDRSAVAPIEAAVHARTAADQVVLAAVRDARAHGITWVEIASALGVSHQAAMKRYKPLLMDLSWTAGSGATVVDVLDALDEARAERNVV